MVKANAPLPDVVGARIRALREERGLTQDSMVRGLRALGLDWTRSALAKVETGHRDLVRLPELLVVAAYFKVTLAELLRTETGEVLELNDRTGIAPRQLRDALGGAPVRITWLHGFEPHDSAAMQEWLSKFDARRARGPTRKEAAELMAAAEAAKGETEEVIARRLEVNALDVAVAALRTFGRSLTDEREARVSERGGRVPTARSLQAIRGHITRELIDELKPVLDDLRRRRRKGGKA